MMMKTPRTPLQSIGLAIATAGCLMGTSAYAQGTKSDYERADALADLIKDKVFRDSLQPRWIEKSPRLWYRVTTASGHEFILADAETGTRELLFDNEILATALAEASGKDVESEQLPFERIVPDDDSVHAFRFNAFGRGWRWTRESKKLTDAEKLNEPEQHNSGRRERRRNRGQPPLDQNAKSPDGDWEVFIHDFDVHVRRIDEEKEEFALTFDGTDGYGYDDRVFWSPDSSRFIVTRTREAQEHKVYLVESSPEDQLQPKLRTLDYLKPGDRIAETKPVLFSVAGETPARVEVDDAQFPEPWRISHFRWSPDGSEFRFLYNERGHQVMRVVAIDANTGNTRAIVNEECATFIDYSQKTFLYYLDNSDELIWMSERDGWNHLYLYDTKSGKVKNRITRGEWVVRNIEWVDHEQRTVVFSAGGIYPDQDPYYIHYARIGFDGGGLTLLTSADATHRVGFSSDRRFFVDSWSRVDLPTVTELRRSSDGELVCSLEKADASQLFETGWKAPKRFVAKGRDGKTDIYGIIHRPMHFDPGRKYPLIELIYAGPHDSHVPKRWRSSYRCHGLAELGFIVVQIDGMGTSNRGKKFHDVCWRNIKDAGFPDRIAWIKAAAAEHPFIDLSRGVGIYGGSAGGQNTLSGLLHHPDFYTVGVADCGCHDNRMDKIWWNEAWMGRMGPHYAENSNVTHAHKLQGKLFLTVGELDNNVDPSSTLQVVDALIKADKDFDFVMVPGAGHGVGERPYLMRRRRDFFVRHLYGAEPRRLAAD